MATGNRPSLRLPTRYECGRRKEFVVRDYDVQEFQHSTCRCDRPLLQRFDSLLSKNQPGHVIWYKHLHKPLRWLVHLSTWRRPVVRNRHILKHCKWIFTGQYQNEEPPLQSDFSELQSSGVERDLFPFSKRRRVSNPILQVAGAHPTAEPLG